MPERTRSDPARLAFTPEEAAQSLGVSKSFIYDHILADVRVVRIGRKRLVPVKELERWLDRHAARVLVRCRGRGERHARVAIPAVATAVAVCAGRCHSVQDR